MGPGVEESAKIKSARTVPRHAHKATLLEAMKDIWRVVQSSVPVTRNSISTGAIEVRSPEATPGLA